MFLAIHKLNKKGTRLEVDMEAVKKKRQPLYKVRPSIISISHKGLIEISKTEPHLKGTAAD